MTPAARVQAAIELLVEIDRGRAPADAVIAAYFRARRYAGGGDRRAVIARVYGVLRRRARLLWRLDAAAAPARTQVLADLLLEDGLTADEIAALCDGRGHAPPPLGDGEAAMLRALSRPPGAPPDWVAGNYPPWLDQRLRRRFGDGVVAEMAALDGRAGADFRVNRLRGEVAAARARLAADGIEAVPGRFSPLCLSLVEHRDIRQSAAYRDGLLEPQDEASQLAALLVEAAPGQQVVDYCAGAGGKTLALAAEMANRGQIYALDQSARRLRQLAPRLLRAGVRNVQSRVLDGRAAPWLDALAGRADRVLVDAPCSGTGAWRRNPETRWRLDAARLDALVGTQRELLHAAAGLVRPGGRLVYAVCSLLPDEGEDVVEAFLAALPGFRLLPFREVWRRVLPTDCPADAGEDCLLLTPARHGTDGFFVAVMQRD